MEKEFVPPKESLELKQLGFDEPCFKAYTEEYMNLINISNYHTNTSIKDTLPTKPFTAPLFQQAFRWFREKHGIVHTVYSNASGYMWELHYDKERGGTHICDSGESGDCELSGMFTIYEKAELECLRQLINLTKNSNGSKK